MLRKLSFGELVLDSRTGMLVCRICGRNISTAMYHIKDKHTISENDVIILQTVDSMMPTSEFQLPDKNSLLRHEPIKGIKIECGQYCPKCGLGSKQVESRRRSECIRSCGNVIIQQTFLQMVYDPANFQSKVLMKVNYEQPLEVPRFVAEVATLISAGHRLEEAENVISPGNVFFSAAYSGMSVFFLLIVQDGTIS